MKRLSQLFLVLTLLATMLAACTPSALTPTAGPIVLTDDLGRAVTLAAPAQKVVSMAPSNTEILYAVGAGSQVIGRDEFSNYPEAATAVQSVGGSMGDYNFEQIVSLKPNLVLAAEINTSEQVKTLEDLGVTVYYLKNPTDMEGMYTNLQLVGQLTGRTAEATALVDSLKQRVAAAQAKVANATAKPKVFYELDGSDAAKPWTAGTGTFIDQLITLAGGENVAATLDGAYGQLSQEALLVANPDVILLGDAAYGTTAELVSTRAGWETIKAVQSGQIVPFN
ncbi:ABC transporter substrate-binding protein, partial [bacterium]|nr:ABC transporter substrate-binding protein [bacterium]